MPHLSTDSEATIAQDPQLAELVRRLVAAYHPEQVFLFGSRARGEGGPDGDYDLLVVVPDDSDADRAASRLGYQALRGTGVAADVVVWRRSSFERRAHVRTSLPYAALHEGVVLHGG
ncbi:MAG: nucleotidyltransferase domain-containing protein [Actinobacteria bacterium]|nr:nucleotidyltransferase domain-containing protein [Actinomycetota bacterium]